MMLRLFLNEMNSNNFACSKVFEFCIIIGTNEMGMINTPAH